MGVPSERRQFRVLFRLSFFHVLDLELLAPGGDIQNLMIQSAAILAGLNFIVAYVMVPRYFTSILPRVTLQKNAWVDEEFLISATIAIVGFLTVLAWDTLLPDLRDSYIFGVLPIRTRIIALAKMTATGCTVGLGVILTNIFTSFCFAFIANERDGQFIGVLRTFVSYWITMAAAGLYTAALIIGMLALALRLLNYRIFLRLSALMQIAAFFSVLAFFFLRPSLATPQGLADPRNQVWLRWLPSYWFLGLFQKLNGGTTPEFDQLANRAILILVPVVVIAALAFLWVHRNFIRRMIELPDISGSNRSRQGSAGEGRFTKLVFHRPVQRALVLFTARTLARSRKHRLLLALYGGIGLAIALTYTRSLFQGSGENWRQPNAPLLTANLVVLVFWILGTRIVFTFPQALRCNWIFCVTRIQEPAAYLWGIRKALYVLAALPIWIFSAIFFFIIWPPYSAALHIVLLVLVGVILVERSLHGFRKLPFACSYMPGKTNLKVTIGIYASLILFVVHQGGTLEFWAVTRPSYCLMLIFALCGQAILARHRFNRFASSPSTLIQFEDSFPDEILRIDFHRDR